MGLMLLTDHVEVTFGHPQEIETVECESMVEKRIETSVEIGIATQKIHTGQIFEGIMKVFAGESLASHCDE